VARPVQPINVTEFGEVLADADVWTHTRTDGNRDNQRRHGGLPELHQRPPTRTSCARRSAPPRALRRCTSAASTTTTICR